MTTTLPPGDTPQGHSGTVGSPASAGLWTLIGHLLCARVCLDRSRIEALTSCVFSMFKAAKGRASKEVKPVTVRIPRRC